MLTGSGKDIKEEQLETNELADVQEIVREKLCVLRFICNTVEPS